MPSETAARVALRASTTRSLASLTSTSEAPPTLITATPPPILARRSWSFSFSYSDLVISMLDLMSSALSSISLESPMPSKMRVESLVMVIFLHLPRSSMVVVSRVIPTSSLTTFAPVRTAMSCTVAFLLSPNPGALTAHILSPERSLFTMRVARASLSTSSAIITRLPWTLTTCSRTGTICWRLETFFSTRRTNGFSNSHVCVLGSLMK
mmetsp:Transcript_18289/g.34000  ORF Transcript_18289/g.34000 Transcript_18289/m.34000 type:complete len:209 (+) Transcript_18289:515-1141(+)